MWSPRPLRRGCRCAPSAACAGSSISSSSIATATIHSRLETDAAFRPASARPLHAQPRNLDMTASTRFAFRLETRWTPASNAEPMSYRLILTNLSESPVEGFRLCVSGPARIDPAASIEGGELLIRLSNHAEFAPPQG